MGRKKAGKVLGVLTLTLLFVTIAVTFAIYQTYRELLEPLEPGVQKEIVVNIPPNASAKDIGEILEKNKVIRNATAFRIYVRNPAGGTMKAGEYVLGPHMSVGEIQDILVQGRVILYSFTIPEGYNLRQITNVLVEKGIVDREKFVNALAKTPLDYDFLKGVPANENRLEGFLFPATYRIPRNTSEEDIVKMMVARFNQEITPDVRARLKEMNLNIRDVVILASLVEREAIKEEDRPLIGAVFMNRLKKSMKLEACSTIQYLLGYQKAKLYYKDLQIESPYNTYKYSGLPPGPIASPGKASLHAVIYPAEVNYLYFVAKEDGYHYFSRTLEEHNRAVAKYVR